MNFTKKQREVWKNTVEDFHRWNISLGATRSGKTYLDYFRIPYRIRNAPDGLIVLLGNTQGTLERNILEPMRNIWGGGLVGSVSSTGKVSLFGRNCYALGADKVTQVSKLQGAGIAYCYGDEITTWAEPVFQMLKSRLDKKGACFDGTCNPDTPGHWFHKFLQSDADIYQMRFTIDDNEFLTAEFVEALKKEYFGTVYYDRFINGLWKAAEGAIYRTFADDPERFIIDSPPDELIYCTAGLDFGGNGSAHALNLTGITKNYGCVVTLDEWYSKAELTPSQLEDAVCTFLENALKKYRVTDLYCDSAEQVLIRGIKRALAQRKIPVNIRNARKGPIRDRIRFYCSLFGSDRYRIMRNCVHTIEAFTDAVWAAEGVSDSRLDNGSVNIDSLDAQEYSTEFIMKDFIERRCLQ
ncbi:MAG: terminase family protein [Oscillospiraceae bacterium]|nr:terminase family protein [Oscillospiraceae bacterium]